MTSSPQTPDSAETHDSVSQRPVMHLMPPSQWLNDPNGLIFHEGQYHLFYQYGPEKANWGLKYWGHFVSRDLVTWTHLPIALAPTPGGPDKDGCWSGSAVVHNGVPTLIYTGVHPEVQCLATSDNMLAWRKHPGNPVIAAPPDGLEVTGFRDPCPWQEDGLWHLLLGSGIKDVGGAALLYTSPDLTYWQYRHPLCIGNKDETGTVWECPDFFPLGDKWVLLVSPIPLGRVLYFTGTYRDKKFTPEVQGVCDFGDFYAAKTMLDGQGRRLLWGWVWEGWSDEAQHRAGWAGALSLPRVLSLRKDGTLSTEPAPELEALRQQHRRLTDRNAETQAALPEEIVGDSRTLELRAEFGAAEARQYGLRVRCSPDGSEETLLYYDAAEKRLMAERAHSSLNPEAKREAQSGAFALEPGETLSLHIFLDNSLVEVYANGRACLTTRIYPTRADSCGIRLYAQGGSALLTSLDVWTLRPLTMQAYEPPGKAG